MKSLEAIAYHEAGHVVAQWAQDESLPQEVSITWKGGIVKGPGFSDWEDLKRHARQQVVGYMAGPMAEKLATGKNIKYKGNPMGDYRQATEVIKLGGLRMSIETAEREATRLLKKNWRLVEQVAKVLLVQGRIQVEELVKIFQLQS